MNCRHGENCIDESNFFLISIFARMWTEHSNITPAKGFQRMATDETVLDLELVSCIFLSVASLHWERHLATQRSSFLKLSKSLLCLPKTVQVTQFHTADKENSLDPELSGCNAVSHCLTTHEFRTGKSQNSRILHQLCCAWLLSCVRLFATPWTAAVRLLCPWGFSRQAY